MSDKETASNERLSAFRASLQARADALARTTSLDVSRVLRVLERTFVGFDGIFSLENLEMLAVATDGHGRLRVEDAESTATLQYEPLFAPNLEEALALLPADTALDTFESANLGDLVPPQDR